MNINFWVEKTYVRFFFDFNDKEDLIFTIKILKKSNESFVEKYRINDGFATLSSGNQNTFFVIQKIEIFNHI